MHFSVKYKNGEVIFDLRNYLMNWTEINYDNSTTYETPQYLNQLMDFYDYFHVDYTILTICI